MKNIFRKNCCDVELKDETANGTKPVLVAAVFSQ